jgi:hypothetical protein
MTPRGYRFRMEVCPWRRLMPMASQAPIPVAATRMLPAACGRCQKRSPMLESIRTRPRAVRKRAFLRSFESSGPEASSDPGRNPDGPAAFEAPFTPGRKIREKGCSSRLTNLQKRGAQDGHLPSATINRAKVIQSPTAVAAARS